jgi:hypothetical protein
MSYNVQTLCPSRLMLHMAKVPCAALLGLQGVIAGVNATDHSLHRLQCLLQYDVVHSPRTLSENCNKGCGDAISLYRRWLLARPILQFSSLPALDQGRSGCLRLMRRSHIDLTLMILYTLAQTQQGCKVYAVYAELLNWACSVLSLLPTRSFSLFFIDANAHFGHQRSTLTELPAVGGFGLRGHEDWAGIFRSRFLSEHNLAADNTVKLKASGLNWFSSRHNLRVDYIVMPASCPGAVGNSKVEKAKGFALQLSSALRLIDHIPVSVTIQCCDFIVILAPLRCIPLFKAAARAKEDVEGMTELLLLPKGGKAVPPGSASAVSWRLADVGPFLQLMEQLRIFCHHTTLHLLDCVAK